jgi:Asp-tRNA(Asn)/Glu-tRNA(Gln) amidotransferase A subunit family amidase
MNDASPDASSAAAAAAAIAAGRLTSRELVQACLDRIADVDERIEAWSYLDADYAVAQAEARDRERREGRTLAPLHGVPVGVKDIFDTADMPTEFGSPIHAGRRPTTDAYAVTLLRAAGAVIMGKTVTTEFAVYTPGKTRNPHNPDHTPGGSSSGSAAAVAAGMVPLALGSQTNGSIIRPASYCGVYGFKPTFATISRRGGLLLSRVLDHVGVFARSIEDVALIAEALMRFDPRDPDMRPAATPLLSRISGRAPPIRPRLGFVRTPAWDQAEATTGEAFAELVEVLGDVVEEITLGEPFASGFEAQRVIMEADLAKNLGGDFARASERFSPRLAEMIERGRTHPAVAYNRAVDAIGLMRGLLDEAFKWTDALLAPGTTGPAPAGLGSTGSPVFCTLWTYLGVPALSLPLFSAETGLPFGAQLIGRFGDDARLLRTARWLVERLKAPGGERANAGSDGAKP